MHIMKPEQIAARIEHTLLHPGTTETDIRRLCHEAIQFGFGAVVINPVWVPIAAEELSGNKTSLVTVAGFPLGASRTETKIVEAVRGAIDGALEIDMVVNLGWLLAAEYQKAEDEISQVRRTLPVGTVLKVIIEAPLLSRPQQIDAVHLVINGGAQFVKSGTGFNGAATVEQVRTLSDAAGDLIKVKAAGGIRTPQQCLELIEAGAARLGSSASVQIIEALKA
jgi:deoxyribose-phosphate aldolase